MEQEGEALDGINEYAYIWMQVSMQLVSRGLSRLVSLKWNAGISCKFQLSKLHFLLSSVTKTTKI